MYKIIIKKPAKKLKGHDNVYRLRIGDYRILYTVDNGEYTVMVINAGNRGTDISAVLECWNI